MCVACAPGLTLLARAAGLRAGAGMTVAAPDAALAAHAGPSRRGASVILRGGHVHGVPGEAPVDALALSGERVLARGSWSEVSAHRGPATEIVELDGRAVLPGFVEPHVHLVLTALTESLWVDVSPVAAPTREDALVALSDAASRAPRGEWVVAFGFDPSRLFPDHPDLTADELDAAGGDRPIFVLNQSGHIAYVNHAALTAAGIGPDTPDPPAGTYVRDGHGRPTGVLHEAPAYAAFLPFLAQPTAPQLAEMCRATMRRWAARGCTTVMDCGIGQVGGPADLELMRNLAAEPDAPVRLRGALVPEVARAAGVRREDPDRGLALCAIKFWADGSTQGFTGAVTEPFLGGRGRGVLNHETGALRAQMADWHEEGWALVVHANGDRAIDQALEVYASVLAGASAAGRGHRIDHFTVAREDQVATAARLGVSVSQTIGHVHYWGRSFGEHVLGRDRAERIDPLADDVRHGVSTSLHSDSPISPVFPLLYLRTAVTRRMGEDGPVLGEAQRVTLDQALEMVTTRAAEHAHLGAGAGQLEPGRAADLVLLDRDPHRVDPAELHRLEVTETWSRGRRVTA